MVEAVPAIEGCIRRIQMYDPRYFDPVYTEVENGGTVVLFPTYTEDPVNVRDIEVQMHYGNKWKYYTVRISIKPQYQL